MCGYDFRQSDDHLEVNHTSYKNLRHEDPVLDLVPICSLHHRPGLMTWELVRSWRSYYRSRKQWGLVWRIITWPLTAAIGRMRKEKVTMLTLSKMVLSFFCKRVDMVVGGMVELSVVRHPASAKLYDRSDHRKDDAWNAEN